MRKGLLIAVVGVLMLGGIGAAVAQLGGEDEESLDLEVPTSPATTTTPAPPETNPPETTAAPSPTAPAAAKKSPIPSSSTVRPANPAPGAQTPGSAPGSAPPVVSTQAPNPLQPPADPFQPQSKLVEPRPGMDNVHQTGWERVEILGPNRVRVHFVSGVEPCSVLDHVDVEYRPAEIVITLFEGSDPAARDAACIMIAVYKAVDVDLGEPIGGRQFVDGAE
jgi:hypothetical protein